MKNLKRKVIKTGIFIGLLVLTGLLLEVFGKYIPNGKVPQVAVKFLGMMYMMVIYVATQYIYFWFAMKDARALEKVGSAGKDMQEESTAQLGPQWEMQIQQETQEDKKSLVLKWLPFSYLALILVSLIIVPYKGYPGLNFGLVSLNRAKNIDFSALVVEILLVSVLAGLLYIFLKAQVKKSNGGSTNNSI